MLIRLFCTDADFNFYMWEGIFLNKYEKGRLWCKTFTAYLGENDGGIDEGRDVTHDKVNSIGRQPAFSYLIFVLIFLGMFKGVMRHPLNLNNAAVVYCRGQAFDTVNDNAFDKYMHVACRQVKVKDFDSCHDNRMMCIIYTQFKLLAVYLISMAK